MNTDTNTVEDTITTLVMKHVPPAIGSREKAYTYFSQYNAIDVRPMEGIAMRGTVFLDFANPTQAAEAYHRLQQLSQQGEEYKKVRVEYAKPDPKRSAAREHTSSSHIIPEQQQPSTSSSIKVPFIIPPRQPPNPGDQGDPIAPHLGINYPPNPDLRYRYPDPTPEILNNMMHAIASVPRLYVQTLHLMNKMNLPPPFGPVQNESIPSTTLLSQKRKHDELVASDESELESDEEQKDKEKQKLATRSKILAAQEQKRANLLKGKSTTSGSSGGMKKIMLGAKKK